MAQFENDKKVIATAAVFPFLFFIYFIAGNGSEYVKYCANQGVVFTIVHIVCWGVGSVLGIIPVIGAIVGWALKIVGIVMLLLTIYQMIGAYKGTIKDLPVIGEVNIIK